MKDIDERIKKHLAVVQEKYGDRVVFISAVGSMNYGLFTETSDVDTKAVILPTYAEIVLKKPESVTLQIDDEQCSVKDLRVYINELKKQGINVLETLVTNYYLVNGKFLNQIELLRSWAEEICHYDENKFLSSTIGAACSYAKRWNIAYKNYLETDDDANLDYKAAYNIVRLHNTIHAYIRGMKFKEAINCRTSLDRDLLLRIKYGYLGPEGTRSLVSNVMKDLPESNICEKNNEIECRLNNFVLNMIAENCWRE